MTSSTSPTARPEAVGVGDLRLPKPPGVIRQFFARHPRFVDWTLVVLYGVPMSISVIVLWGTGVDGRQLMQPVFHLVVVLGVSAALLYRRTLPLLSLAVAGVGFLVTTPFVAGQGDSLPLMASLYAVAVYASTRAAWLGLVAASAAVGLSLAVHGADVDYPWAASFSQYVIVLLVVTLLGVNIGNRKRYLAALLDRAAQLARERDQQAELAAAAERARIARELHDVVAHSLSVIVALSDGAEAIAVRAPARSRAAMRQVSDAGRASLQEMRRLLGVMGGDDESGQSLRPQPGMVDLGELLQTYRSAGLPVRFETEGHIPEEPGLQLVVYRIVQESLTNVLRYASGVSAVVVRIVSTEASIMVSVRDDGTGTAQISQGLGRGILGMTERAALYGGTLTAGPEPGRGWRVYAAIPLPSGSGEGEGEVAAAAVGTAVAGITVEAAETEELGVEAAMQTDGKGDE